MRGIRGREKCDETALPDRQAFLPSSTLLEAALLAIARNETGGEPLRTDSGLEWRYPRLFPS